MSSSKKLDLGLQSAYDELFMNEQGRAENRLPKIYDIPLSEIDEFPNHPYQVRMDEDMTQLVESVKERGIITPVILRKKEDGRYEMVSGHRRMKACELAGLETVKADVQDLTRDEAIILMVESNLQRSTILPSEKAAAYKMRLEAMNRQGERTDLTCSPVGNKLSGVKSSDVFAEQVGESKSQIFRYIRLTELVPGLVNMVDEGRIAMRPAVELSYLSEREQEDLLESISYQDATPSLAQAIKMRQFSKEGKLSEEVIESIMCEEKPNQREKISFRADRLRQFIPASVTPRETEDYVLKALEYYQRYRERQRQQER
jgi:ParB family chromosome partitioning protein